MNPLKKSSIFLILVLLVLTTVTHTAQTQDLVNVEPERCFLGGTIKIFGWVKPNHPRATFVELVFTKPSSDIITEKVKTEPDGKYNFLFKDTDELGKWKVTAQKAGTSIKKEATFEVSHTVFLIPLCVEVKNLGTSTNSAYTYFKNLVVNYPDFPGKDEIEKKVDELLKEIKEMEALLALLENAVRQMNRELLAHIYDLPDPVQSALGDAAKKADEVVDKTKDQIKEIKNVLESSKEEAEWCYIWMSYHDLCEKLKFYNNFLADSLKSIGKNLIKAEATQGLNIALKFIIGKVIDAIIRTPKSPVGTAKKIMGIMASLGTKVYGYLLKNCTHYTGEAEGEYYAELLHKKMTFYTMSYKISGKMDLIFKQRKPGDPAVYLKGRFRGSAKDFACFITMAPFAMPDTIGPVWCLAATPLVASPFFILYIEGKAADDRMELKLKKVGRDFKLKSRAFYVMLSSAAYQLPIPGDFSFPLQNAEWFLTRVTKISNPDIEYFRMPIEVRGDTSVVEKEFNRTIYFPETKDRVGVKVVMKLKIKVCSPACK